MILRVRLLFWSVPPETVSSFLSSLFPAASPPCAHTQPAPSAVTEASAALQLYAGTLYSRCSCVFLASADGLQSGFFFSAALLRPSILSYTSWGCALCGCCWHHPCTVNVDSGLFTLHHLTGENIWLAPWAALVRAFYCRVQCAIYYWWSVEQSQ